MTISGYYADIDNNRITVTISGDSSHSDMTISEEDNINFDFSNPVVIDENIDSIFDEIITTSCEITLYTTDYVGDAFFTKSPREMTCTITKAKYNGPDDYDLAVTLFNGYVSPASFNQPFCKPHERFTITAVDKLSTLQYYYYRGIRTLSNFNSYLQSAGMVSFASLLDDMFGEEDKITGKKYWDYKGTKAVDLTQLYISEAEILGESFDDVMTQDEILEQICRFLSCHAKYDSNTDMIILFSWNSSIHGSGSYVITGKGENENIRRSDMDISIDDVYSQIMVKDNVTAIEDIVSSPLTQDNLTSSFSSAQRFMREYTTGVGVTGNSLLHKMIDNVTIDTSYHPDYDVCKPTKTDWWFQIKKSNNWELYDYNGNSISSMFSSGRNQHEALQYMQSHNFTPMLISLGKNEFSAIDPEPTKKPSMDDYLMISVNGDMSNSNYDSILEPLKTNGLIKYTGFSAANLTPSDDNTTNYIIIDGKITLTPIILQSGQKKDNTSVRGWTYTDYTMNQLDKPTGSASETELSSYRYYAVPGDNNSRFLMRRYYTQERPSNISGNTADDSIVMIYPNDDKQNILTQWPYSNVLSEKTGGKAKDNNVFIYKGSRSGNDVVDNLPILACRMTVGDGDDKVWLVETYVKDESKSIYKSEYKWYKENELPNGKDWFTIGINPSKNDRLLGQEFRITDNTNDKDKGIDAQGLAIPITKDMPVSGRVDFTILGPVNATWGFEENNQGYITNNSAFWYIAKYFTIMQGDRVNILSFVKNIIISDFSVKIYTDNGYADNKGDSDIYYISDEIEKSFDYIAGKYETEFRFITQLTTSECAEMDVENTINVNSVLNSNKTAINTITDLITTDTCKAEEHYVKEYYDLTNTPKMIVSVTVADDQNITKDNIYTITALPGRNFMLMSKSYDLKYNTVKIQLREI